MSKIEVGRWSEQLRRMLGQKGESIVAGELSPEVSPTIQLESSTAEWAFLKHVRLSALATRVAPGVGFLSILRLRNPADSGAIAVIEKLILTIGTTDLLILTLGTTPTDLTAVATTVRDSRWDAGGAVGQNALVASSSNAIAAFTGTATILEIEFVANTPFTYDIPFLLLPGRMFEVGATGNNTRLNAVVAWRERSLPALEA